MPGAPGLPGLGPAEPWYHLRKERSRSACWLSRDTGTLGHVKSPPSPPQVLLRQRTALQRGSALRRGRLAKKQHVAETRTCPKEQAKTCSLLAHRDQGGVSWPTERKGKATAARLQLPGMVQERLGSSSPFLAPLRHSTDDAGRKGATTCPPSTAHPQPTLQGSSHCTEQNWESPNAAELRCLHALEPGSILHRALGEQLSQPACGLQDINQGIRGHWATRCASQTCRGTATQPPAQPTCCKALRLQSRSSGPEPEGSFLCCLQREEQGMPESRNHQPPHSDRASPHAPHHRDTHPLFS